MKRRNVLKAVLGTLASPFTAVKAASEIESEELALNCPFFQGELDKFASSITSYTYPVDGVSLTRLFDREKGVWVTEWLNEKNPTIQAYMEVMDFGWKTDSEIVIVPREDK